ncbi:hypothetical protein MA16_Dca025443 [Dendrobium catenatum]|uniref:Uncharacterized protein n=1 Tax=Dendrobium catenatum TaxID=906689 RepID=A0A2I0VQR2_9ASPA|nr:hypothetical protein MA16_Dca025443 [Dendrobium catenatum]
MIKRTGFLVFRALRAYRFKYPPCSSRPHLCRSLSFLLRSSELERKLEPEMEFSSRLIFLAILLYSALLTGAAQVGDGCSRDGDCGAGLHCDSCGAICTRVKPTEPESVWLSGQGTSVQSVLMVNYAQLFCPSWIKVSYRFGPNHSHQPAGHRHLSAPILLGTGVVGTIWINQAKDLRKCEGCG